MAQQQHRSEIQVSLNDSAVNSAIRRMVDGFKSLSSAGARSIEQVTNATKGAVSVSARVAQGVGQFGVSAGATTGRVLATGDTASVLRGAGAIGGSAMGQIGLSKLAGALPFVGDIAGALVQRRMTRIGQVAGLERAQTELALGGAEFGGIRSARRQFTQYGISASEGVNALRTLQRSIGERSALFETQNIDSVARQLAQLQLRGIDAGTLGQFTRGGAMGGGALGNTTESIRRAVQIAMTAQGMGMTGAGTQRLLSAIASNTQRIASEGLQIDESEMSRAVFGISDEARRRGFRQLEGVGAVSTYQRLGGAVGGVMGGFRSQFGGLAQGALLASAGRNAQSPLDVMRNLERFRTDPMSAIQAMRGQGIQGDLLRVALSGLGLSLDQVDVLMGAGQGALGAGDLSAGMPTMRRGMAFNRMIQGREERLMSLVESDPRSANAVLSLNENMEKFALSFTKSNGLLIKTISEDLKPAIDSLISAINTMRNDPMKPLKDLLPF